MRNAGVVLTRDVLMEKIWGIDFVGERNPVLVRKHDIQYNKGRHPFLERFLKINFFLNLWCLFMVFIYGIYL